MNVRIPGLAVCIVCAACGDDEKPKSRCTGGVLESDLESTPWMGPAVDDKGALELQTDRQYVVSSTYGVPIPGADGSPVTPQYDALITAIRVALETQPGLVGLRLGSSDACASGRTLAVWESEDAMYEFVVGDAHRAAMGAVHDVLKPGYAVTHWDTSGADDISFARGAAVIAAEAQGSQLTKPRNGRP